MRYVESSAILALLLMEQPVHESIEPVLHEPQRAITSVVTLIECQRTILRAQAQGRLDAVSADSTRFRLARFIEHCNIVQLDESVLARSSESFGDDLIRTLDAIHVATALVARRALGPIGFVSLDHRVRMVAAAEGFAVQPAQLPSSSVR
jgi:predicted nucleic acid-binding protein